MDIREKFCINKCLFMYLSVVQYIMVVNAKVKVYIVKSELLRREIVVEQSHKEQCLM